MPLTFLERGFHLPHAMYFVAHQILIDVALLDDVIVLQLTRGDGEVVIRDQQLAFADQFPVVAVR